MVKIQPLPIDVERETDGRVLASVPDLPGVMAYGHDQAEAIRKVKSIALQVLADKVENGEEVLLRCELFFRCDRMAWDRTP